MERALPPGVCASGSNSRGNRAMTITVNHIEPIVALLAGILILIVPRILNYVIAAYLIIIGLIGIGLLR
jgi:hypothetical protein